MHFLIHLIKNYFKKSKFKLFLIHLAILQVTLNISKKFYMIITNKKQQKKRQNKNRTVLHINNLSICKIKVAKYWVEVLILTNYYANMQLKQ